MNPQIAMLKERLSPQQLLAHETSMLRYRKEPVVAFLLAFFLGIFGAHHFYLGYNRAGAIMLVLTLSVVGMAVSVPWKIVNWFTVWGETADANDDLEYALLYWGAYGQQPPGARQTISGLPMAT